MSNPIENARQAKLQKLRECISWLIAADSTDKDMVELTMKFQHPRFTTKSFASITGLNDSHVMKRLSRVIETELQSIIYEIETQYDTKDK